jgi:hypothetical protein
MNEATRRFIETHAADDVHRLALSGNKDPDVDMAFALTQIEGRQRAKAKLPLWAANPDILWPSHLALEQCSSEQTAHYKARIAGNGQRFVDLTGGFGVDFAAIAPQFIESIYVERQESLCELTSHNFKTLCLHDVETVCGDSTEFLQTMPSADLIFIDPARRDRHGTRTYAISDCTPALLPLKETLLRKAPRILLKFSPMLDWRKAVKDLGENYVSEVHIVSVNNECKELLIIMERIAHPMRLICANDAESEAFSSEELHVQTSSYTATGQYLYEPNASLMKAGCFGALARRYNVKPVSPDSHLFLSEIAIPRFPGRSFYIIKTTTMNKQDLFTTLSGLTQANISVRHFPLTADKLRRRLRLNDGGDTFIFATTQTNGKHILLFCKKQR